MKYFRFLKKALLFFALMSLTVVVTAQQGTVKTTIEKNEWTEKSAGKWFRKNEWQNGLNLKIYPQVDKIEFAKQYHNNKAAWDKAFAFMRDSDLTKLKPGKHVIDGDNVFATITEGPEKDFDKTAWESHRKYIDLQYVITGKEKIGVAPVSTATVIKPYNETSDGVNYTANGTFYIADPGTIYLFFPQNAHRPNIKVDGYDVVKKMVIKIKVVN
jgi:YhcH/YjgK/YiaL family protein